MDKHPKKRRLFFSLWPDEQTRHLIAETFSQLPQAKKGREMQLHNLHMTLYFIGSTTDDIKECLHTAAQTIHADSFALNLDHFGYFPRAKIFWMGCHESPHELIQLHDDLTAAIENCGYRPEKNVFIPHVTLMKKYVKPMSVQIDFSIQWPVDDFALVESRSDNNGVKYRVIEKYSLSRDKLENKN
jgi:2'-5' RNA ligase